MSEQAENFFKDKRPWSCIKDQVLQDYMAPYLAKVNRLRRPILLIDGYAGPGIFEDGSSGSPIIMCENAEKYARGNYHAIFINNEPGYHEKLGREVQQRGWTASVHPLLGDSKLLLRWLSNRLKDQTVFLYLDPFGPTGCDFALLKPFLDRDQQFSTEILLTMNMPGMHRLAARHTEAGGRKDEETIRNNRQKLNNVFGGEYWKDVVFQDDVAEEREIQLIEMYRMKLSEYLPYTGSCPVRERTDRRIKYFIVFASRHPHAMLLLNDIMAKAYFAGMHRADFSGRLWEVADWREMRSPDGLARIIMGNVTGHPGETRAAIWFHIVQEHFMRYLEKEYNDMVKSLIAKGQIRAVHSKSGRLNDDSKLYPI